MEVVLLLGPRFNRPNRALAPCHVLRDEVRLVRVLPASRLIPDSKLKREHIGDGGPRKRVPGDLREHLQKNISGLVSIYPKKPSRGLVPGESLSHS